MSFTSPVRPNFVCCPIGVTRDDQAGGVGGDDGDADPKMALMEDPIVGIDKVVLMNPQVLAHWRPAHSHLPEA